MTIKRPTPPSPPLDFSSIFRGAAIAVAISFLGALTLGAVYHLSDIMESTLPIAVSIILLLAVFGGGFSTARRAGNRGLFHGLGVGIVVFALIWILMAVFLPTGVAFVPLIQKLAICLLGGALGGVLGILL